MSAEINRLAQILRFGRKNQVVSKAMSCLENGETVIYFKELRGYHYYKLGVLIKIIVISFLFSLSLATNFANTQDINGDILYATRVSDSECKSKGYDCSLKNKCVTDGSLRPYAHFHPKYKKAMKDVTANPAHMMNWPQIYFICPRN
jgi:hypothetical protein